jgi:hypothetical protein
MEDMEQAIREHAYHLWVADGCHDGSADKHWLAAQRQVLAASLGDIGRVSDTKPAVRGAGKKSTGPKSRPAAKTKTKRKVA